MCSAGASATIRPARAADAVEIGRVHVRAWQATYRGLMPQEFLDGLDPASRAERWGRLLSGPDRPGHAILVAELDGLVVGFASCGPSRDEDAGGARKAASTGEVYAIYLFPDRQGLGIGAALMRGCLAALRRAGFRRATLWVLDGNQHARSFYRAGGWQPDDGITKCDDSHGFPLREVRYRRDLP